MSRPARPPRARTDQAGTSARSSPTDPGSTDVRLGLNDELHIAVSQVEAKQPLVVRIRVSFTTRRQDMLDPNRRTAKQLAQALLEASESLLPMYATPEDRASPDVAIWSLLSSPLLLAHGC
jgi:hypothetical protein